MNFPPLTEVADKAGRIGVTAFGTRLDVPTYGVFVTWEDGTDGMIKWHDVTWYPLGTDPTEW